MAHSLTWLMSHRKYVLSAFVVFSLLVYFKCLPYSLHSGGYGAKIKGHQAMDHLPEDLDYRLQGIQNILSTHDRSVQKSIFTKEMFSDVASSPHEDQERLKPLTAIILKKTNQSRSIQYLVEQLLNYPFFREIIIYNADPLQPLNEESFAIQDSEDIKVHVVNVAKNERLDTLSRFTLCASMASNEYCYFQDDNIYDDVDGNPLLTKTTYWDTLYVNFLRYPALIHVNVQSSRFIDQYRWRFHNQEIKMHAGYSDLGFGAIVPRWKAQNFLTQLSKSGLGKERLYEADAYFSIWSNQYPWLLDNPLGYHIPLDTTTPRSDSDVVDQSHLLMVPNAQVGDTRRIIYDAARRLHRALQSDLSLNPKDYVDRMEEMPQMRQRDTRASCVTDRCLFITNIDPIPSQQIDMIPVFDMTKYLNPKDWDKILDEDLNLPKSSEWVSEGYHNAVDQRNDTCWTTRSNPQVSDYFGLVTLGNGPPSQLVISTSTRLPISSIPLDQVFQIYILRNKYDWNACRISHHFTSTNPISSNITKADETVVTDINFELDCSYDTLAADISSSTIYEYESKYHVIHTLKVVFMTDWEIPFKLCELTAA